jgi:O-antigen ligase
MLRRRPATTWAQPAGAIVIAIAILYVALALPDGGYSQQLIGGATAAVWLAVGIALTLGVRPRSRTPAWERGAVARLRRGPRRGVSGVRVPVPLAGALAMSTRARGVSAVAAAACLVGFAAWTALSVAWASDDGRAFVEVVRVLSYLGLFVLIVLASPRGSARAWLTGLAIGLTVVAGLALVSRFEPSFAERPLTEETVASSGGRLSYPIGYWNGLAACMALALVLLAWLGAQARTPRGRATAVAAVPLPVLAIYFSSSRGGAVAAAIGLAALVALGPARPRILGGLLLGGAGGGLLVLIAHQMDELVDDLGNRTAAQQGDALLVITLVVVAAVGFLRLWLDAPLTRVRVPRRVVTAALAVTGIVIVAGVAGANPAARWDDFKTAGKQAEGQSDSSSGRYQYWSAALDAFSTSPVEGIGAGEYEAWWNQHGSLPRPIRDAHSLFLETLGELGIVGLAILVAFFGVVVVSGVGARRRWGGAGVGAALAVLVAGAVSAAIDWTWVLPACFGPVVVAAGLLTGPAAQPADATLPGTGRGPPATGLRLGIVTLLLAWTAIWAGGVLFLTELKLNSSQDAAQSGDLVAAADDARQASTLQPWAADPRLQLALVQVLGRQLDAANRSLDEAIDRAPDDYRLWLVKSVLEYGEGHRVGGKRALERARRLNPRAPILGKCPPAQGAPRCVRGATQGSAPVLPVPLRIAPPAATR